VRSGGMGPLASLLRVLSDDRLVASIVSQMDEWYRAGLIIRLALSRE
jgi:hypothetical protein